MVDRKKIEIGIIYKLNEETENYFKKKKKKGVFAWGFRIKSAEPEEGLPIALLKL